MKYESARSFRQALEDRLRTEYPRHRIPRLRKMIAFERFMVRLGEQWILKGGYALQLRTDKARTTHDIDLLAQSISPDQITDTLLKDIHQDMGDFFQFFIERTDQNFNLGSIIRYQVISRLAGRVFEQFHIDVGLDDPLVGPVEYLSPPPYLAFAGILTEPIPCYPVTQHIAEKLHALVRPRTIETSRVKDLVDILLFACMDTCLQAEKLYASIQSVFDARKDLVPAQLDQIPLNWGPKYNQFTNTLDLPFSHFNDAVQAAQRFINPVLCDIPDGTWNPESWKWEK